MKKILLIFLTIVMVLSCSMMFACGEPAKSPDNNDNTDNNNDNNNPKPPVLKEITGVTFNSNSFVFDGQEHELTVDGQIPDGVNVTYSDNKGTNAGTYNASALLKGEGYKDLNLEATLTIKKADFTNINFESQSFVYDGSAHKIVINGSLPEGTSVAYTCKQNTNIKNAATDVGEYDITATLTNSNYNTLSLTAKLTIKKANFPNIEFNNQSFDYDGLAHSITIVGMTPEGTTVTYTCAENPDMTNSATGAGKYTITATLTNPNYNTIKLDATMTIKGVEDERHVVFHNNKLYFANALDHDYLYCKDLSLNEPVKRLSFDIPYNFTISNNTVFFRSKSILGGAIKNITSSDSVSTNASQKAEYLCSSNGTFYFVVNSISKSSSGIFKLVFDNNNEPIVTLLSEGKAKHLQYYNNTLYFADGNNGWKLSKINVNSSSPDRILVRDEKITTLLAADGYLYYTVNNLIGDYIENYNISNDKYTKLTIDAGTNLTKVGNYLYYINVDLFTSHVQGNGIYRVTANPILPNNTTGEVFLENTNVSSLTNAGPGKIAYYRVNDQMLCVEDTSTKAVKEILKGFVVPEYSPISTGSKTMEHNGLLFYMDLYKDKCLYSYNPKTKALNKLTANKVSDFTIIGDTLYFNMVSYLVNNDLYKVNLKTGGEPEKISTYDANDIVSYKDKIFYVEQNAAGVRTAIHEIDKDGNDKIIYSKGVNYLTCYKDNLYFVDGDTLHKMPAENYTIDNTTILCEKDVDKFVIHNDTIYYREVLIVNKQLSSIKIDGTNKTVLVEKRDPTDMFIDGNYLYYYSDTTNEKLAGFFRLDLTNNKETKLLDKVINNVSYYGTAMSKIDDDIYFINYKLKGIGSDSHLYKFNINDKKLIKVQ